jgi:hypothetical protein
MHHSYLPPLTVNVCGKLCFMPVLCAAGMAEFDVLLRILLVETNVVQSFTQVGGAHHAGAAIHNVKLA